MLSWVERSLNDWSLKPLNIGVSCSWILCSGPEPEGNYVQSHQQWMGGNNSLPVQRVMMMLTQGMCLVHCCCTRWMFMIFWGVPQQCYCSANTFPPCMRSFGVILQTGWSWTSLYSPQDHTIFNFLLSLLPVTLPCRAGGRLTGKQRCHRNDIVPLICKDSFKRMVESKLNRTAARNWQLEPVVLLPMHFLALVHAAKAASVWAGPPKVFIVMATWIHLLVLYMRKQVWPKRSEGQKSTQRLFHSWPKSLCLALVWYTFSALWRGSYCQNCRGPSGLLPTSVSRGVCQGCFLFPLAAPQQ